MSFGYPTQYGNPTNNNNNNNNNYNETRNSQQENNFIPTNTQTNYQATPNPYYQPFHSHESNIRPEMSYRAPYITQPAPFIPGERQTVPQSGYQQQRQQQQQPQQQHQLYFNPQQQGNRMQYQLIMNPSDYQNLRYPMVTLQTNNPMLQANNGHLGQNASYYDGNMYTQSAATLSQNGTYQFNQQYIPMQNQNYYQTQPTIQATLMPTTQNQPNLRYQQQPDQTTQQTLIQPQQPVTQQVQHQPPTQVQQQHQPQQTQYAQQIQYPAKREKKILKIVDPKTNEVVNISNENNNSGGGNQVSSTNSIPATSSVIVSSNSSNNTNTLHSGANHINHNHTDNTATLHVNNNHDNKTNINKSTAIHSATVSVASSATPTIDAKVKQDFSLQVLRKLTENSSNDSNNLKTHAANIEASSQPSIVETTPIINNHPVKTNEIVEKTHTSVDPIVQQTTPTTQATVKVGNVATAQTTTATTKITPSPITTTTTPAITTVTITTAATPAVTTATHTTITPQQTPPVSVSVTTKTVTPTNPPISYAAKTQAPAKPLPTVNKNPPQPAATHRNNQPTQQQTTPATTTTSNANVTSTITSTGVSTTNVAVTLTATLPTKTKEPSSTTATNNKAIKRENSNTSNSTSPTTLSREQSISDKSDKDETVKSKPVTESKPETKRTESPKEENLKQNEEKLTSTQTSNANTVTEPIKNSIEIIVNTEEKPIEELNSKPIENPTSAENQPILSTMKERRSLDSTANVWTPEQPDAKKRYNRDFLLSMKDKEAAKEKPDKLPVIPNVIIDDPSKQSHYQQSNRVYSSGSMDGQYSGPNKGSGSKNRIQYGNKNYKTNSMQGGPTAAPVQKIIDLQKQEIKLTTIENAWKPVSVTDISETEKILREVQAILNKLTPQNFEKLTRSIIELPINNEERLKGTIDKIFEKSIDEPAFSQTYANLCKVLSSIRVTSTNDPSKLINFRTLLLTRCQKEFDTDFHKEINYDELAKEVDECKDETKKKELNEQLQEKLTKAKRRSLGNIRFIGELFKLNMLTEGIMHDCINRLLKQESDEENLECLCRLLSTIGKELDKKEIEKNNKNQLMNSYFDRLHKLIDKKSLISSRIRFMVLDNIDLRKNNWVQRRPDNAPKKIDEIHKEVLEEEIKSQAEIARLHAADSNKRSSITKGRGGYQQSGLKSTSMGSDSYDSSRTTSKNMANKLKDVKQYTSGASSNVVLGPPSYKHTPAVSKPSEPVNKTHHGETDHVHSNASYGNNKSQRHSEIRSQTSIENDKRLDKVKKMEPSSQASSQASSRETSASRPDSRENISIRSSDISSQKTNDKINKKKVYTLDEIERKVTSIVDEYIQNDDINETLKDFEEFQPENPDHYKEFVRIIVENILERSEHIRTQFGRLFYNAIKKKKIELENFVAGFKEVFETAEDMAIDIPLIGKYLAEIIAPMVQEDMSLHFLIDLCNPIIEQSICSTVVSHLLHCASNRLGHNTVAKIFKSSNLNIKDFLKSETNPAEFLKKCKLEWIIQTRERTQSASISSESYETKLYEILQNSKLENENIFEQIENEFSEEECKTKPFLRSLVTAVCRSCVCDTKIDQELFKKRGLILSKFIDRNAELELESLFAVQALDHKLQHQPGFIRVIFDMLYDEDIISEDAFHSWQKKDREDGHAISALSLKAFFDWLDETEVEEKNE